MLSIVGAIAVAAIVVGAIALDKANQDATPTHVTVTIPIISPVERDSDGHGAGHQHGHPSHGAPGGHIPRGVSVHSRRHHQGHQQPFGRALR